MPRIQANTNSNPCSNDENTRTDSVQQSQVSRLAQTKQAPKPSPINRLFANKAASMRKVTKNNSITLLNDRHSFLSRDYGSPQYYQRAFTAKPKLWLTEIARNTTMAEKRNYSNRALSAQLGDSINAHDWKAVEVIISHLDPQKKPEVFKPSMLPHSLAYPTAELFNILIENIPIDTLKHFLKDQHIVEIAAAGLEHPECILNLVKLLDPTQQEATEILAEAMQCYYDLDVLKVLLQADLEPNGLTQQGLTPLQKPFFSKAAYNSRHSELSPAYSKNDFLKKNDIEKVKLLLNHGADINALSAGNLTALHYAVMSRADNGYAPDTIDENHLSSTAGFKFLYDHGADPGIAGEGKENALWYADNHTWNETDYDMFNTNRPYPTEFKGHPKARQFFKEIEIGLLELIKDKSFYPFIDHWTGKQQPSIEMIKALPHFKEQIEPRSDWQEFAVLEAFFSDKPKDQRASLFSDTFGQTPISDNQYSLPAADPEKPRLDFALLQKILTTPVPSSD